MTTTPARPVFDRAELPSQNRSWAWTGLSGWREWEPRAAKWVPSNPPQPAPGIEWRQSITSQRRYGTQRLELL